MIRIILVDAHPLIRQGMTVALDSEPDMTVVGDVGTGEEAVRLAATVQCDVAIVDAHVPKMTGLKTCAELLKHQPQLRVVVLNTFDHEPALLAAFAVGAKGFAVKDSSPAALRLAVRTVADGGTYVDPRSAGRLIALAAAGRAARGPFGLTLQEMRVLELLPRGVTNRDLGRRLGVSEATVKTHLHHAMRKLRARNRAEATAIALREGLA